MLKRTNKLFKQSLVQYCTQHQKELMKRGLPKQRPIQGVKDIVLVSSGKGGVGKSTTAAAGLKLEYPNKNVGLLDTDIFGPTVPLMMNLNETPLLSDNNLMVPLVNYGVKCMSFGFLIEESSPVIWRGLMIMQALEKLMRQVEWEEIDYLIVDTPPGTGDTHLSLIQNLPISGVVIVTTPQTAAIQVTKRGITMYQKLNIPIIGLVENMSYVICPNCSKNVSLGHKDNKLNIELLENFSLSTDVSEGSDRGVPVVLDDTKQHSKQYRNLAKKVAKFLEK